MKGRPIKLINDFTIISIKMEQLADYVDQLNNYITKQNDINSSQEISYHEMSKDQDPHACQFKQNFFSKYNNSILFNCDGTLSSKFNIDSIQGGKKFLQLILYGQQMKSLEQERFLSFIDFLSLFDLPKTLPKVLASIYLHVSNRLKLDISQKLQFYMELVSEYVEILILKINLIPDCFLTFFSKVCELQDIFPVLSQKTHNQEVQQEASQLSMTNPALYPYGLPQSDVYQDLINRTSDQQQSFMTNPNFNPNGFDHLIQFNNDYLNEEQLQQYQQLQFYGQVLDSNSEINQNQVGIYAGEYLDDIDNSNLKSDQSKVYYSSYYP